MAMKSDRWYIRWPGAFYAEGPITLPVETSSQREARKHIRERYKDWYPSRLPAGFECWPTND